MVGKYKSKKETFEIASGNGVENKLKSLLPSKSSTYVYGNILRRHMYCLYSPIYTFAPFPDRISHDLLVCILSFFYQTQHIYARTANSYKEIELTDLKIR